MTTIKLDLKSKVPIYIQIRDHLKLAIATGEIKPGEQMPPVRDLAQDLLINPNTVSKAYNELEREGYIHTRRGMGTFVSERETQNTVTREDKHIADDYAQECITKLLEIGLTPSEIRTLLNSKLPEN